MVWCVIPFVFFSLSRTKLPSYILPCFPPMGLLIGLELERQMRAEAQARPHWSWVQSQGLLLLLIGVALAGAGYRNTEIPWTHLRHAVYAVCGVSLLGGLALLVLVGGKRDRVSVPGVAVTHLLVMGALLQGFSAIEPYEYVAPMISRLREMEEPKGDVSVVTYFCRDPALAFYLRRVVPDYDKGDIARIADLAHRKGRVLCGVRRGDQGDLLAIPGLNKARLVGNDDIAIFALTPSFPSPVNTIGPRE
jgi:hypothetical protein